MSDEIKEIFRRMKDLIEHQYDKEYHTECDLFKDIQDLLDYITNLQQENKQLKEALLNIKEFIDKHTKIVKETGTKYLLTSVKDDNLLINIINKILGDKE